MNKQFFILLILTVAVNTGMGIIIPVLPNLLRDFGFGTATLSLPFVILVLARIISKPYAGKALQRFTSKALLTISFIIYTLVFVIYPYLNSPEMFIAIRFLEGIVEGIAVVVLTDVAIALSSNSEKRGAMMGYFSASFGIGYIIGPLVGSFAYDITGIYGMFWSGAVIGGIGVVCSLMLVSLPKYKSKTTVYGITKKLGYLKNQMRLLPYYSPSILRRSLFFSFMMVLPIYLHEELGVSFTSVALYFTISAVITTTLMPLTGHLADKVSSGKIIRYALLAMGILIASFGLTQNIMVFTILFILETIAFAIMLPAGMKFFADLVQEHPERGTILGIFGSVTEIFTLFLAITILPLYAVNSTLTWFVLGAMCIVAVLPFFFVHHPGIVVKSIKEKSHTSN
jgi:MFS family permease